MNVSVNFRLPTANNPHLTCKISLSSSHLQTCFCLIWLFTMLAAWTCLQWLNISSKSLKGATCDLTGWLGGELWLKVGINSFCCLPGLSFLKLKWIVMDHWDLSNIGHRSPGPNWCDLKPHLDQTGLITAVREMRCPSAYVGLGLILWFQIERQVYTTCSHSSVIQKKIQYWCAWVCQCMTLGFRAAGTRPSP